MILLRYVDIKVIKVQRSFTKKVQRSVGKKEKKRRTWQNGRMDNKSSGPVQIHAWSSQIVCAQPHIPDPTPTAEMLETCNYRQSRRMTITSHPLWMKIARISTITSHPIARISTNYCSLLLVGLIFFFKGWG